MIRTIGLLFFACSFMVVGACGDDDSNDGSGDASTATAACTLYCTNAMTNCTGGNELYASMDECTSTCAAMTEGTLDETSGNTAHCRAYHAGVAADDPALHCPHASASGDGVCGSLCEAYCDQIQTNCTGDNASFDDTASCLSACAAMTEGNYGDKDGNSVQCRTYHASFPAVADGTLHCPHASTSGDGVCGSLCDAYCDQTQTNCIGGDQIHADDGACATACAGLATGSFDDKGQDSVQCRTYHASFPAAADSGLHCPHTDTDGGGVCVAP